MEQVLERASDISARERTARNKEAFLKCYSTSLSIIAACKACNIHRRTYDTWTAKDPEFFESVQHVRESFIDFAESKLFQLIKQGNFNAIKFFLEKQAKHRGYGADLIEISQHGNVRLDIVKTILNADGTQVLTTTRMDALNGQTGPTQGATEQTEGPCVSDANEDDADGDTNDAAEANIDAAYDGDGSASGV